MIKTIPVTIEAVQYDGVNVSELQSFIGPAATVAQMAAAPILLITSLDGGNGIQGATPATGFDGVTQMMVRPTDIIIRTQAGGFKKLTEKMFNEVYGNFAQF